VEQTVMTLITTP